jgi:hypothetical protein
MAGLWSKDPNTKGGKYLVLRRDGTVPSCGWFVLLEADPEAPAGLRGYAAAAEAAQRDPQYVADIREMADQWERSVATGQVKRGDPDAGRHRVDDPEIVAKMVQGRGA